MKNLAGLTLILLLLVTVSCTKGPASIPTPTPDATPAPYMPSDKYRFTPPYSVEFDLESSTGLRISETSAEYPSYTWSDTLKKEYHVLNKYAELPQTKYVSVLPQGNSATAKLVLTSTFDEEFNISVEARARQWLAYSKPPEGIQVAPSHDIIHLKARHRTTLDLKIKVGQDVPSGLYYVNVLATIEGYRREAVLWLLVSS